MKRLLVSLVVAIVFVFNAFGQSDPIYGNYKVRGIVQDKSGAVFSNLNLSVQKGDDNRTFVTDINGEFELELQPGNYEITVYKTNSADFKAFIKIQQGNLNPNNLVFVLDPNKVCCVTASGKPFPKPTSLPRPPYPPAARAVRARGEVVVAVKIGKDGNVTTATIENGYPLLRTAALAAARSSRFEPSETDDPREAKLTYVFASDEKLRTGVRQFSNAYRIEIVPVSLRIDY